MLQAFLLALLIGAAWPVWGQSVAAMVARATPTSDAVPTVSATDTPDDKRDRVRRCSSARCRAAGRPRVRRLCPGEARALCLSGLTLPRHVSLSPCDRLKKRSRG